MKSAVIKTGGKQYLVREGDTLRVEKLAEVKVGDKVNFDQVLMTIEDDKINLGKPLVEKAVVSAVVQEQDRARKITIVKFKPKTRERNKRGHRQPYTAITIEKIN
ncbi:MAG: 50S ribosomal protein L21 [Patescibacteria group bacterium]